MPSDKAARPADPKIRKPRAMVVSTGQVKNRRDASSNPPTLQFHPLTDLFPLMRGAEFDSLVDDIRQHGLHELIVVFEGKILDGRNRYRACIEAGIEPRYWDVFFDHDAALAYVISANIHRRHLTSKQKRKVIAELLKVDPTVSDRAVAKKVGADKVMRNSGIDAHTECIQGK